MSRRFICLDPLGGVWVPIDLPGASGDVPPPAEVPPGAPILGTPTVSTSSFILPWTAPSSGGAVTGYRFYRGGVEVVPGPGLATSVTVTGLSADTDYPAGVEAVGPGGVSPRVTTTVHTAVTPPMPTLSTVGYTPTSLNPYTGDWRYSTQGSPEGRRVSGTVYLDTANAVVREFAAAVTGTNVAPGGNYYWPVRGGQIIENATIGSLGGIGCKDVTLRGCDVGSIRGTFWQVNDYQQGSQYYDCSGLLIENSIFRNLTGTGSGVGHFEALHAMGLQGGTIRNTIFEFATADAATKAQITAVLSFDDGNGTGRTCKDIVLEDVWLYGGGYYQVYLTMTGASSVTRVRFHRSPGTSPQATPGAGRSSFTQSGNTLADGSFGTVDTNVTPLVLQTA